jgi:hypothetical protein
MDPSAIAIHGLQQADAQFDAAAEAIVTGGTAPVGGGASAPDLGADMISLSSAQTEFEADIATLTTADQIEQSLIDTTA